MANRQGFTIIELAVVLAIVGLLLGGLLLPLSVQVDLNNTRATEQQLVEARDALIGFALATGRLPCPDCSVAGDCPAVPAANINDGQADYNDTAGPADTCFDNLVRGNLPWVTLGVSELDAWGNRFTYRVTGSFADEADGTGCVGSPVVAAVSLQLCSDGDIIVNDQGAPPIALVADNLPAIVVSHGKNANQVTTSTNEPENSDGDAVFVSRNFIQTGTGEFDDVVTWVSPNVLKYRMNTAGLF